MNRFLTLAGILLSVVLAAVGCGGGGGSSGGDDGAGSNNGGYDLPVLTGLSGDADNQNRLFYTMSGDDGGLFAVDPSRPEAPQQVDTDATFIQSAPYFFQTIHVADRDPNTGVFSGLHADRVFYAHAEDLLDVEYRSASTDPAPLEVNPQQVSNESTLAGLVGMRRFLQYDLKDADGTFFAYPGGGGNPWRVLALGDDANTPPLELGPDYQIVATSLDADTQAPGGWLVIDSENNHQLDRVDRDGQRVDAVNGPDNTPIDGLVQVDPFASEVGDGSQFLALQCEQGEPGQLWHYTRGDGDTVSDSIEPVLNAAGEPLEFQPKLLGLGLAIPPAESIVLHDDTFYYFHQEGFLGWGPASLIQLNAQGWEELLWEENPSDLAGPIVAGERLIWTMNDKVVSWHIPSGQQQMLEADPIIDGAYVQGIEFPVQGSRDGWVFYNREMFRFSGLQRWTVAVAAKADGSARIEVVNARWVGASGTGRLVSHSLLASELSEVFLVRDSRELAAVSAANPAAGAVRLGQLPAGVDEVQVYGPAPGPHRLLQLEHEGNDYEVIYVNTREEDSLVHLMEIPREGPLNRPLDFF